MKSKKSLLALLLSTMVLGSAVVGCGSKPADDSAANDSASTDGAAVEDSNINLDGTLPIIKDPSKFDKMTMMIVTPAERTVPADELAVTQKFAEETGVYFDWQTIPQDGATEKLNLMLNGGSDLPDAFWNGVGQDMAVQFSDQGTLIPTEQLIQDYVPRLAEIFETHPEYKAGSTAPDGHSYGFPYIEEMRGLVLTPGPFMINKAWLDLVGKEVPTTVDEFVDCLKAFRDYGDLNGNGEADEFPYATDLNGMGGGFGSYNTFNQFTGAFGLADTMFDGNKLANHLRVVDGKVVYAAADEAYKNTATFFNGLQTEGLIDPDSFSPGPSDWAPMFINKVKGDVATIGVFGCWAPANELVDPDVRAQYVAIPRLEGENGKTGFAINNSEMQDTSMVAITTACEYPEVIAAYVNHCMLPENSITLNWGAEGYVYEKGDDGILHFMLDDEGQFLLQDGFQTFGETRNNTTPTRGSLVVLNEYYDQYADYTWDAVDLYAMQVENGKEEIMAEGGTMPKIMLTVDELGTLSRIQPQLDNLVQSYTMNWVLDGGVDGTWEEYLGKLDDAGLQQYLETYQGAYDRAMGN